MTNVRVTVEQAAEWRFCPYCGRKVEWDQEPDLLFRTDDGVDVERSEDAGFSFEDSLSHCGYHIRLWEAASDAEVGIE